ncbi:hypothetical protein [Okeania sp. SIO2B9]|uniref:hypothetical protein n=1 Tax=Okeania sp. SIO2B9 TaxID=2607782 RepID=UPI001429B91C|nr:hypothetical protein [Okeania sp. SIO2B9]NES93296.1 hypothetical protein [Okeania sp. SIO2B9]
MKSKQANKLSQTKQCSNCPWLQNSNPYQINGYCREDHIKLESTILSDVSPENQVLAMLEGDDFQAMLCHHSKKDENNYCIGWLHNQLENNNIRLRGRMAELNSDN